MQDTNQNTENAVVEPSNTEPKPEVVNESVQSSVVTPEQVKQEAPISTEQPAQDKTAAGMVEGLQNIAKPAANQPTVSGEEKLWGFISYLPLIGPLLALILKPESDYIKLHGRQGLLIFIFSFFNIFIYLFPYIGPFLGIIVHFGLIILAAFSMYQALIGNWWKIPVFGDIAEMIPTDLFVKVSREAVMGPEKLEKNKATIEGTEVSGAGKEEVIPAENVVEAQEQVKAVDQPINDAGVKDDTTPVKK